MSENARPECVSEIAAIFAKGFLRYPEIPPPSGALTATERPCFRTGIEPSCDCG